MLHYLLMSRSLTYAQRAQRTLERSGVSAVVSKIPSGVTSAGCSYCVKISEKKLSRALEILKSTGLEPIKVFSLSPNGAVREVAV